MTNQELEDRMRILIPVGSEWVVDFGGDRLRVIVMDHSDAVISWKHLSPGKYTQYSEFVCDWKRRNPTPVIPTTRMETPHEPLDQRTRMRCNFLSIEVGNGVHEVIKNKVGTKKYVNTDDLLAEVKDALEKLKEPHCIAIIPMTEQ